MTIKNTGVYKTKFVARYFFNRLTLQMEKHNFDNAHTLKLWVASMCLPWGDYEYKKPEYDII
jgi:hypothetical protein